MSDLPRIAGRGSIKVSVEAGKNYAYCTCGLSDNQPFCNGAHKGTGYTPFIFTAEESKDIKMCACKHTKQAPYCDGQHKCLPEIDATDTPSS